jgi:DNA replication protein DnaC
MTTDELHRALRQLRLGGMADTVAVRAQQARAENLGPLDFIALLVHDELQRRRDRLVRYREAHVLFEDLLLACATGERTAVIAAYSEIPLLIIDDLGMRQLPATAAEDLLEIMMRRYERASTVLTSNRPIEEWPKLFGDTPAVAAFLDRLMHHSHLIEIRGKSYRLHEHSIAARRRKAKASA